ncbi:MAG: hypothetical protein K2M40_03470 [Muribaculaceae bacterium]|nr:hypothetical protein [Bacteroidales bacterium]MBD5325812.1 hypothetical protein [Bacteroides sp.]MDE6228829.1 hypothetical protein [Muribaculaceae bacterium]MBD5327514.1 hypothetical protein [Bacteroides sp.]MBD5415436.1 hypothetical protein [Bacteroides sp.]
MRRLLTLIFGTLATVVLPGCHSIELKDNIVSGPVYVPFRTAGDWEVYGVSGALDSRRFIRSQKVPQNYPYPDYCYTGFGGVLLTMTVYGDYEAYDLACPVEHSPSVLVAINRESNMAVCSKCGSVYDVFCLERGPGHPVSGVALERGYGLTTYRVLFNVDNCHALISR